MSDFEVLNVTVRTLLCGIEYRAIRELNNAAKEFKCSVCSAQKGRMTTWVPATYIPVLIVGTSTHENVVIICSTGIAYKMSDPMQIPLLPEGLIIIANCTMDDSGVFRVLIYDGKNLEHVGPPMAANDGTINNDNNHLQNSIERYTRLRHFVPRYFVSSELVKKTFSLQWLGYYENAVDFLSGKLDVGHKIGGLVSTTGDPMKPTRPVQVKVPELNIRRFS